MPGIITSILESGSEDGAGAGAEAAHTELLPSIGENTIATTRARCLHKIPIQCYKTDDSHKNSK